MLWLLAGCTLLSACAVPRPYLGEPINVTCEPQGCRLAMVLRARGDDDLLFCSACRAAVCVPRLWPTGFSSNSLPTP